MKKCHKCKTKYNNEDILIYFSKNKAKQQVEQLGIFPLVLEKLTELKQ